MTSVKKKRWQRKLKLFSHKFSRKFPQGRTIVGISLGAIAGALSRYYFGLIINQWLGQTFPFSTFFINISGAFVMGFFTTLALEKMTITPDIRLLIGVGFLGSYTTFSSYELDAEHLLFTGQWGLGFIYWFGSTILGVICLEMGSYLARKLP